MRIERACKVKAQASIRVRDLMRQAPIFGLSNEELSQRYVDLKGNLPKGTPGWIRHYLDGMRDAMMENLYHTELEFCYIMKDGKRYSCRKDSDIYYEKHGITPKDLCENSKANGFFWIKSGKPFSRMEEYDNG